MACFYTSFQPMLVDGLLNTLDPIAERGMGGEQPG
jgi:hypothetical protein